MNLWEQLNQYAKTRMSHRSRALRLDLWTTANRVAELEIVIGELVRQFDVYRSESTKEIDRLTQETDRLRMKVEVLEVHDEKRRN